MISILLAGENRENLSELAATLKENNVNTDWADSGSAALSMIKDKKFDLVITDEKLADMTGRKLVEEIISINAMMNCIAVSSLSPKDFHEEFEGLGVLMQLPGNPGKKEAYELIEYLKKILNLTGN